MGVCVSVVGSGCLGFEFGVQVQGSTIFRKLQSFSGCRVPPTLTVGPNRRFLICDSQGNWSRSRQIWLLLPQELQTRNRRFGPTVRAGGVPETTTLQKCAVVPRQARI